ncbi:hypothetical protein V6N13_104208 [Hibiscus sabdariffa]
MHEARSLPTHTTISPLTCPLRTSSSIHTHRSTTHTTERFGRGAEETMSEGTPQPLGTIKSEKRVNPQIHVVNATVTGKVFGCWFFVFNVGGFLWGGMGRVYCCFF